MTGMVCSFHVSAVDHLLSGGPLFSGDVVCTRLSHKLSAVLPFFAHSVVVKLRKSVGYVWLSKVKRYTR
jgi:hypothetical protein